MKRRNLIIVRCGRNSLHTTWLSPAAERTWDLYLSPYQDLAPTQEQDVVIGELVAGPKWTGLRTLLNGWNGWRDYERIWLPDDDIFASQETINRFFALSDAMDLELSAPALQESSYYAHYSTMRNQRCFARRCGFVEIMVPCFSAAALERLLPTLDLSPTGWGWGLDSLWPKLLGYEGIGIIDTAPVLHTRPVGMLRDVELATRVRAESDHIMSTYGCSQIHTTFSALGEDLGSLSCDGEALTTLLAEGWRYLIPSNPAVLPWLVNAQQPSGGWSDYPVQGTPTSAQQ